PRAYALVAHLFYLQCYPPPPHLHSFPTRRSSDLDRLIEEAHERNIRVIIDLVPNHTSNQHPWFRAALQAGPRSSERDRYLFRGADRKSTRLNSSHGSISYAVFCLKKKNTPIRHNQ